MNRDVWLRIEGSLLERLLQHGLNRGARFALVRRVAPRVVILAADAQSAELMIALCEKYGLNCRTLRRGGWAALKDRLRARWTLAPCVALGFLACMLFLSRVWMIDVDFTGPCAERGDRAEILSALEAAGVERGMATARADTDDLQKQLMAACADYSFIGVRRQGVRLLVEASPEVPAPQLYALNRARDLVAARDGVIESVTVHSGAACVKPGDTVRRGQLLIRGEEDKSKEETAPVAALGEVIARCWYEGEASGELERSVNLRTGRVSTGCRLKLMNLSLTLTACEGYAAEDCEVEFLPVGGLFLPLEIERSVHWETETRRERADETQLEARLTALAQAQARSRIAADSIQYERANQWTDVARAGGQMRVRAVYEVYTDIAATRDALIEEVY